MSISEKIGALLLSFLISLFGFVSVVCLIINSSVLSSDFLINVLRSKNYYDAAYIEYCEVVESYCIPAGVPEGTFQSVVGKETFINDAENIIRSAYGDKDEYAGSVLDIEAVYNEFYNRITSYAESKDITVTDDIKVGIDNVAGLCSETYSSYVTFAFIDTIGSYANDLAPYFKLGVVVSFTAFVLLIVLMCSVKKWRKVSNYLTSVAFIANGFMLMLIPLLILLTGKHKYVNIDIRSMYLFAVGYVEKVLLYFVTLGAVSVAIGLLIAVFMYFKKRKPKYKDIK